MGGTDIRILLPSDVVDALFGANAPSSSNVFATIADLFPTYIELDPVIAQISTPPPTGPMPYNVPPIIGDRYLVLTGAVGLWAGQVNNIAEWDGAVWVFTVPVELLVSCLNPDPVVSMK